MIRILLFALLAWFLYNLVFRFIIPVYKTTREMKKKFREMHQQMQEKMKQSEASPTTDTSKSAPGKVAGDYIDFEEIK